MSYAQNVDEKLAAQFYENGEYDKAGELYKKLLRQKPNSLYIYTNYLNVLVTLEDQKAAEKLVEKHIKGFPTRITNQVDLGYVYLMFDEKVKANKYFDKLIKTHHSDRINTLMLAQAFSNRQMQDRALLTYEKAAQKQGVLIFYQQLLSSYRRFGKTKDLTDLALEVLQEDPSTFKYVTKMLDVVYESDTASEYLQMRTLQYAQKQPGNQIYDELLLEVFLQQKKYSSALRQVKSLDKRNNNEGSRVLKLAQVCVQNQEYTTAIKGYEYILTLEKSPYYLEAQRGVIDALYLKTTSSIDPDKEEVNALITKIKTFVSANGVNYKTAYSLYRLAELHIFYGNDVPAGIEILNSIITTPRLQAKFMAKSKLLLGDAYLMQNEIWESKLLYGQVDKQFKEDALGQEAKFKSAKLSYFIGDFELAKGQLDILKTATSQLISNNAIELSLLIQDNTGLDSTEDAMKEYAQAEFYLYQNKIDKCSEILNMLPFKYPDHSLNDDIFFLKAKVQEKLGNYEKANELYTTVYEKYAEDILADNALYRSANITLNVFEDTEKAQALYEKLVLDYNSSLFVTYARKYYFGLKEGMSKDELLFIEPLTN